MAKLLSFFIMFSLTLAPSAAFSAPSKGENVNFEPAHKAKQTAPAAKEEAKPAQTETPAVTPIEKKFDKNKNGSLNLDEIKLLLQHKNSLIHARGKAKVESVHEKKFDTNNDGMLDLQESQEIEESL